ncbi:MAG TPA: DUF922 domain-containing protein [Polyangia bacterium]|nr:DUF922 domain-containing protein [Polyangia bacterium]
MPLPHGLTWTHFTVVQTSPDGNQAQTGYDITASFSYTGSDDGGYKLSRFAVTVALVSGDTWVVSGQKSAALLNHERLHWVIATLVGRELDAELANVTGSSSDEVQQSAQDLIQAKNDRALAIGQAYDDDTDHGQDDAQQKLWLNKVHGWEHNSNQVNWP